jgi:hypothetical protein
MPLVWCEHDKMNERRGKSKRETGEECRINIHYGKDPEPNYPISPSAPKTFATFQTPKSFAPLAWDPFPEFTRFV